MECDEPIAWRPTAQIIAESRIQQFIEGHRLASFQELLQKSTGDVAWFWEAMLREMDIRFETPYERVMDLSRGAAWPAWCVGGRMNIVQNCLDKYRDTPIDNRIAVRFEEESGRSGRLRYGELRQQVNRAAGGLRQLGLGPGDVIGVFLPMTPRCVIALLATVKIGGIALPLFSGFGTSALSARLNNAGAKAMFTADGFLRRGRIVPMKAVADEAADATPTLRHLIVSRQIGGESPWNDRRDRSWEELIDPQPSEAPTHVGGADEAMMILYTSGTTGQPKGAVHSHCGFPVKAAADMLHGMDLHADETIWWISDMGWMMGPWLVFGVLLNGATMMIYDGAPDFPGPDRVWATAARHNVTALGISPTLVRALRQFGDEPVRGHDLSGLRKFGSTGEPWNPEPWRWLFQTVGGGRLPILNYSGGTEISGGILSGNVISPLKPCAFAGPMPGMAADVVDEQGRPVRGRVGELVIRQPWIGMTRGFWNDPQRYLDAYWSRLPGVWVHGDWAEVDEDGMWYILGRSDDTIKLAGKRLGPAEVESVLVGHPAVVEAAAIGAPDAIKGQALVCFCVLADGSVGDDSLRKKLKERVGHELGKAMEPAEVRFVSDLPKTRNAKVMRRIVRAAWLGEDPGDTSSLENPAAVEEIRRSR